MMKIIKNILVCAAILSLNAADNDNDNNMVQGTYNPTNRETTYTFNNIKASHIPPNIYEAFEIQPSNRNFQRLMALEDPEKRYRFLEQMFQAQNEPNEQKENLEPDELE